MDDIPQELINHIISFIKDDRETLRKAMLVNCRLYHSSTLHFFRALDLTVHPSSGYSADGCHPQRHVRFQKLLHLIHSNPNIPNAVQTVEIRELDRLSEGERQYVYPTICAILNCLPRVDTIILRSLCFPRLSSHLRDTILKKVISPNTEKLDVWNCQFSKVEDFLRFLNDRCTIRSLRIALLREAPLAAGQSSPLYPFHHEEIKRNSQRKLESLTIEKDSPTIVVDALCPSTTISRAFDLMCIRHLVLTGIQDFPAANSLLRIIGGSLESLELSCPAFQLPSRDVQPPLLDLQFNPNLVNLRISSLQWTETLCPAHRICSLFRNVVTLSKLRDIQLVLTAWIKRRSASLIYEQWIDLDDLLSGGSFPSVQSVGVLIHGSNLPSNVRNTSELVGYFPKLNLIDKISVKWHDDKK